MIRQLAILLAFAPGITFAERFSSGPQAGQSLGPFQTVKCAGAAEDGVEVGEQVCYRSRYSSRPQVILFTRKPAQIAELVKQLDLQMGKNNELRAFVNILDNDLKQAEQTARKLGQVHQVRNVAIVVPLEHTTGPENYRLNQKATSTVLIARRGKVMSNYVLTKDGDAKTFAAGIIEDLKKL